MPRIPTAGLNAAAAAVVVPATTYYLSLHSADPGTTGASELTGGGYARQSVTFGAAAGGVVASSTAEAVPNAGTVACTHFGLWSAATGGTYIGGGALGSAVTAASVTFAVGAIAFTAS